jgi:hypothetical protein
MQKRQHSKQASPLDLRLIERAEGFRKQARGTPAGVERDRLLRLARQAEAGAYMSEALSVRRTNPHQTR